LAATALDVLALAEADGPELDGAELDGAELDDGELAGAELDELQAASASVAATPAEAMPIAAARRRFGRWPVIAVNLIFFPFQPTGSRFFPERTGA
jgi:hypothetical protein